MVKKKEGDGLHPASHYLVVENPEVVTTWHLRVRNMKGELDHTLMGAAWAALHEGYRGNKYAGPNKAEALDKLEKLYEKEGMDEPGEEDTEPTEDDTDHMTKAEAAIKTFGSEWVWAGVSHNAYLDRTKDILPLALLERDLERQTKAIAAGRLPDYGGLWVNHSKDKNNKPLFMVAGRALFKAIAPDTRMIIEAGTIKTEVAKLLDGAVWPMSIGYYYTQAAGSKEYSEFVQYERSVLVQKQPANPLTFFKVYKREAVTKDVLGKLSGE